MADASERIRRQVLQGQAFSLGLIIIATFFGLLLVSQLVTAEQNFIRLRNERQDILRDYLTAMQDQLIGLRQFLADSGHPEPLLKVYRDGRKLYEEARERAHRGRNLSGQTDFFRIIAPVEDDIEDWQARAEYRIGLLRANRNPSSEEEADEAALLDPEWFRRFRDRHALAETRNNEQLARQQARMEWDLLRYAVFALMTMALGIGAGAWVSKRAAQAISEQAKELMEHAERVRLHRQELSERNALLQQHQDDLQTLNRELDAIGRITAIAGSELRVDGILAAFEEEMRELVTFDRCSLLLLEPDGETARVADATGVEVPGWEQGRLHPLEETLLYDVIQSGKSARFLDLASETPQNLMAQDYADAGTRSLVMTPLIARGRIFGSINFSAHTPNAYTMHAVRLLEQVAGRIASALENARLYEQERGKSELLSLSMQETHHRVKNNLQAVSALLDFQLMDFDDSVPREVLQRTITQIKAIAVVHDLLSYESEEETVDVKKVVEKLLPLVMLSYPDVSIELNLTPLPMTMRRVTSLALVINELALNACKHNDTERCRISVLTEVCADRKSARVVVRDNGPGFPPGFDPDRSANVGLQLVTTLVRNDLNGSVAFTNEDGAKVEIQFPISVAAARATPVATGAGARAPLSA